MMFKDTTQTEIEEMDMVRYNITLPRRYVEDDVVDDLREREYPNEEIRMVGLLGYLTQVHGYQYGAELLDTLLCSMQANIGLDDEDAQRFRAALEAGIREHHDNAGAIAA